MFAVLISGRPILTSPNQISPTQAAFTIPPSPPFHHLAVFLTPGTAMPPDSAAAVYVQLPPDSEFRLLGALDNDKQSAIFRIRTGPATVPTGVGALDDQDAMTDEQTTDAGSAPIVLGISLEPASQVAVALATARAAAKPAGNELVKRTLPTTAPGVPTKVLAQRIIANAFNFLASFSGGGPGGHEVVPLKSFQEWWRKFEKRIEMDPGFLERGDGV
ncbi:hypothetical protein EJ06DRAFT_525731 [Trichodelitschia bisporula]|uniref:Uncharacterized protein n=1 Tax=Trichodelitschia bisporula TaxID=703511 RepID=A0A6G1IAI8_9PEZI|nr:hypothetical protein EJ06DRAFT_525731 [Trichodelitschia bisporula]